MQDPGEPAADLDAYRTEARAWIEANLPRAARTGEAVRGAVHSDAVLADQRGHQQRLHVAGWAGISVPRRYGGQGLSAAHAAVFEEEAAEYQLPDFGILGLVTYGIVLPTILAACSEAFKIRHVPRILAGQELWCQLLSEPGAGSDLAGILTRATPDGDQWIVTGTKVWSSGAMFADFGLCITRTDWDVPKHEGLTWFALPLRAPGSTVRPIREISGVWEFCEVFLDDVVVAGDEVMGEVDAGWAFTHTMLVYERGALRGGRPELPSRPAPDLVASAQDNGLLHDAHVRQLIAAAHVLDVVRTALNIRVEQSMRASGRGGGPLASYLKLAKGIYDPVRARIAMEIAGDTAIAWEAGGAGSIPGISYLNARVQSIAGGSNEMQRNGISEKVLGLPREPSFDRGKPFRQVIVDAQHWRPPA